jgi:hypothetical protein
MSTSNTYSAEDATACVCINTEFTSMYKSLCKLPEPLVDALLYQGYRQPEWSD